MCVNYVILIINDHHFPIFFHLTFHKVSIKYSNDIKEQNQAKDKYMVIKNSSDTTTKLDT